MGWKEIYALTTPEKLTNMEDPQRDAWTALGRENRRDLHE